MRSPRFQTPKIHPIHRRSSRRTSLHKFLASNVQHVAARGEKGVCGMPSGKRGFDGYVRDTFCEAASVLLVAASTPHALRL